MKIKRHVFCVLSTGSAALVLCFLSVNFAANEAVRFGLCLGIGLACLMGWASYAALAWAWTRSEKIFYSVWGAGILARLAALAATAFLVNASRRFSQEATLISLTLGLTFFWLWECHYLTQIRQLVRHPRFRLIVTHIFHNVQ